MKSIQILCFNYRFYKRLGKEITYKIGKNENLKKIRQSQISISVMVVKNWRNNLIFARTILKLRTNDNAIRCLSNLYSFAIPKTIAKIGWQVVTVRFILGSLSPIRGRNIEFRRALRNGSISSIGPPCGVLPLYTMFLTSHRQRNANSTWKSVSVPDAVCHNEAHVLTRMRACEKAGSYAVKSVMKSRGPIAISPESPCLFFSSFPPPFLLSTSARSIINL